MWGETLPKLKFLVISPVDNPFTSAEKVNVKFLAPSSKP